MGQDSGGLDAAAREAELAEFGRVYRSFKQDNPDVEIQSALRLGQDTATVAPVLRRNVKNWQPDKLLSKRWGVPEIKVNNFSDGDDLPGTLLQKKYAEQVKAGIAKATTPAEPAPEFGMPAGLPPAAMAAPTAEPVGDPARPPKSLFTSLFGDADSDDD